jgi:Zn-dependent M28 family amino/carboxypeptidase
LKPTRRSVIFVLFAGEEAGRLGSLHFINHPPVEKSQIRVNINLEQVGRRNPQLPGFWVVGSESLAPSVYSAALKAGTAVQFEPAKSRMGVFRMSDNYSFYAKDIPALLISCGGFPEQHSPDDMAELIDFEHLRRASLLTYALVMELGSR